MIICGHGLQRSSKFILEISILQPPTISGWSADLLYTKLRNSW